MTQSYYLSSHRLPQMQNKVNMRVAPIILLIQIVISQHYDINYELNIGNCISSVLLIKRLMPYILASCRYHAMYLSLFGAANVSGAWHTGIYDSYICHGTHSNVLQNMVAISLHSYGAYYIDFCLSSAHFRKLAMLWNLKSKTDELQIRSLCSRLSSSKMFSIYSWSSSINCDL